MALVGDKADYGLLSVNAIGIDALNIPKGFWLPGSASVFNGYFGAGALVGFGQASLVAGPGPFAFTSHMYGVNVVTGSHITNGVRITNGIDLITGKKATVASASWNVISPSASINSKSVRVVGGKSLSLVGGNKITIVSPKITLGGDISGSGNMSGINIAACPGKKNFDIKHPSKEGHRLRHVCLEGPSADVFLRGTLEKESMIKLPEYWKNLVDPETITINLTPIGIYQELFVEKIELGKNIIVRNNLSGPINCYYTIYGERIDVEKNIPEYSGLTSADYPGDNSQCNINGL
jgi:hypothetical protein